MSSPLFSDIPSYSSIGSKSQSRFVPITSDITSSNNDFLEELEYDDLQTPVSNLEQSLQSETDTNFYDNFLDADDEAIVSPKKKSPKKASPKKKSPKAKKASPKKKSPKASPKKKSPKAKKASPKKKSPKASPKPSCKLFPIS